MSNWLPHPLGSALSKRNICEYSGQSLWVCKGGFFFTIPGEFCAGSFMKSNAKFLSRSSMVFKSSWNFKKFLIIAKILKRILAIIFKICVNSFWLIGSVLIYNYCSFTLYCTITYICSVCFVSGSPPSQPLKPLITVYDKGSVDPDSIHCPTPQKCVSKQKNVGQKVSRRKNPFSIYVDDNGLCFILHSKIWLLWDKWCKSWFISNALTP